MKSVRLNAAFGEVEMSERLKSTFTLFKVEINFSLQCRDNSAETQEYNLLSKYIKCDIIN